jgi:ComF family protein
MGWVKVDEVLDLFLPPHCALCGQAIARRPLCAGCLADLPWLKRDCVPALSSFDQVWSALAYEYPVDRLIAEAKFGKQLATARALGELLALGMPADIRPPDLVVPVPLHWRRQAERGFNQAEEIARGLCRQLDWRLAAGVCQRTRPTPAQSTLGAAERRINLHGAFVAGRLRSGLHILVVDDVLTTGATAEAVASALRQTGAAGLQLCTVAHALNQKPEPEAAARAAMLRPAG